MSLLRAIILTGFFLSALYAGGQDAIPPKPDAASNGDEVYSNGCLGRVYHLPDGWKFTKVPQAEAGQIDQKTLFEVKRNSATASAESLELDVLQTPTLKHPNLERLTILFALSFVRVDGANNKITRDAYPVTIAGRSFYRSDLRQRRRTVSLFVTWYRGYAVLAWASADSPQDIEDATTALRPLSFGEDKRTTQCFDSAK
jgi:hypothetical protein